MFSWRGLGGDEGVEMQEADFCAGKQRSRVLVFVCLEGLVELLKQVL